MFDVDTTLAVFFESDFFVPPSVREDGVFYIWPIGVFFELQGGCVEKAHVETLAC